GLVRLRWKCAMQFIVYPKAVNISSERLRRMRTTRKHSARASIDGRVASKLTHLDSKGRIRMVDVGEKPITRREAIARARIRMAAATMAAILGGKLKKGEALAAARLAGIMAAKRTHELIPLCHQLPLEVIEVEFHPDRANSELTIETRAVTQARTGVEMEAMVAASVAALTIYEMAKVIDRGMAFASIRLVSKRGGRSEESLRRGEPPPASR